MNNRSLKVSVVIATYNRAKMVVEAVKAAWNQTYTPDEIVVSDDCSPDNTLELLRELQKEIPILRIVESVRNSGGVPNWNQVIEASTGDLIAWCSDDDRFKPQHLENAVAFLLENANVDLVHAGFEEIKEYSDGTTSISNTTLKSAAPIFVSRRNLVDYMADSYVWPFHPSTLVFRRTLWKRTGAFDPKYALADTDWFIRAANDHTLVYLPYMGVVNRRHYSEAGNWSVSVGSINMQKEFYESISAFVDGAKRSGDPVPDLDGQYKKWLRKYKMLMLRIFISRCRAGNNEVAWGALLELARVGAVLRRLPLWLLRVLYKLVYYPLNYLQYILPGGKGKYSNLGKHVPS